MAMIQDKVDFMGVDEFLHKYFWQFTSKKSSLRWDDSPLTEVPLPPVEQLGIGVEGPAGEGASVWTPPEDYFVPYFTRLNTQFQESITPICQALDEKFSMQEQFLRDSFINPMTTKVNSLADQVERMATKEELGQLCSEVATQVHATRQLK